ncbi:MAG: AmmeMemoRadiSam system protein A [Bacillota bacterium]|nr:AmmeMemoRadiSam system protein A [Bacillota bacterium]
MSMIGAVIVPHPPLIIPEIGCGQERGIQQSIDAYRTAVNLVAAWKPEVLILASPHTIMYADYFHISPGSRANGDMSAFRAPQVHLEVKYDEALRTEIIHRAEAKGIEAGTLGEKDASLDHGAFIPLWFLRQAGLDCPIIRMGLSGFSPLEHYRLGQCIAEAVDALGKRAVFIASGDLSHKLKDDGPYGFAAEGPQFDKMVTAIMSGGDFLDLLSIDLALCDSAAECGLRAFQMMAGALDGLAVEPRLLSYEGPFGVGYAVASFTVSGKDETRCYAQQYERVERERLALRKAAEDPWVRLARLSLETYIRSGKQLRDLPDGLPCELTGKVAGVFVSLHLHGQLRGCIGTISPLTASVAEEIVRNAVSAGTDDPRFSPISLAELELLEYKVDVLGAAEPVSSPGELDAKRYGVIVTCGRRRGLLLPDLEGVDTVEEQIAIACRKAGIAAHESYTLERFEVVRHV